jgi:methyl halide transferase
MDLGKNYWEGRYVQSATGWDLGMVSPPLKAYFDQLTRKDLRILIPGAGNAYEAEYLHSKGFTQVYVVDIACHPLANLQRRCPDFPSGHLLNEDFFELDTKVDLLVEQTFFCALPPHLRPYYAQQAHKLLNKGGKLMGVLFDDPLNTDQPPFGGSKEEYRKYFEPYFELKTFEKCYNSIPPRQGRELFMVLIKERD